MTSKSTTTQLKLFPPSSTPWTPHAYQKKAVKFLLEHAAAALFLDPGLGKTSVTLAALKLLLKKGLVSKVLLIAPLRVCHSVWPAELEKWEDFHGLKIVVLHGKNKEALLKTEADIYIINPEGLDWLLQVQKTKLVNGKTKVVVVDLRRWKQLGFDTLVVDELSKFKHTATNRFKAMKLVLHTFGRRWGLTGSPAANGLLDLFGQCFMLDQGRTLGPYISHYRMKYFAPGYDGFTWTLKEGADEEIYARVKPLALRMAAEDYLDMPTVIENNIKVVLPDDVRRVYQQLEDDLIAKLDKRVVVAANAASASIKCRQVASGGIYLDPEVQALVKLPKSKREWANLHEAKLDALEDLIDELQGSPLLIAYDFEHDLDRLRQRFGDKEGYIPVIGGGVSIKESKRLEELWNKGLLDKLFVHPQSAAHGLNLQGACHHVAWHTLTWDFELYDQLIRRVRRQGQKERRVFVHHIMASGTIDEVMLMALKGKNRGQQALFEALKSLRHRK
jgi:SNF2 family DNA or RNA helicase